MSSLRNATIKLAFENPEMRGLLLPLLSKQANTNLPILMGYGLNAAAVRYSNAFMVYQIEPEANKSKFYEAVIVVDEGTGYYTVMRRWGVLMPNGMTTRITGDKFDKDPRFSGLSTLGKARQILMKVYKDRLDHGYVSAFGPDHKTPDGRPLTPGKYPTVQDLKPAPKAAPVVEPMPYKVWDRVNQLAQEQKKAVYQAQTATQRGVEVVRHDLEEFCADNSFEVIFKWSLDIEARNPWVALTFKDRQRPLRPSEEVEALFMKGTGLEVSEYGGGTYSAQMDGPSS